MESCPICFEDMDMALFNDPNTQTATCFKLECGHAYHTACIIRCLSHAEKKCPQCNGNKDPAVELSKEGLAKQKLKILKRDPVVREAVMEMKASLDQYSDVIKQLKRDTREYIEKRKADLLVQEKRRYMQDCLHNVVTKLRHAALERGPVFLGALTVPPPGWRNWHGTPFERTFYGKGIAERIARLRWPRFWSLLK